MTIKGILRAAIGCAVLQVAIAQAVSHTIILTHPEAKYSRVGFQFPARAIRNSLLGDTAGENNTMLIGPWIGSWKPTGFATYNQDTFNMKAPYREIEWYEMSTTQVGAQKPIRHCYAVLDTPVEYSSNIYVGEGCKLLVQEARPEGWTQHDIGQTGDAAALYKNEVIEPAYSDFQNKFDTGFFKRITGQ